MAIIIDNRNINGLVEAGLTTLQARVYLCLVEIGEAGIKKISQNTSIDRSNVYKTIAGLENLELIEKKIGMPNLYRAFPIPVAISILLKRKNQEYTNMLKSLEKLVQKVDIGENRGFEDEEYFKILPAGSETFCRKWEKTLKNIEHSVDLIATEKREPKDGPIWDIYVDLLEKGVNVRWIIDRSKRDDKEFLLRVKQFQHLFRYPSIEMKVSFESQKPWGIIADNKVVVYFLDGVTPIKCSRTFWTNNPTLMMAFKNHFETMWTNAVLHPGIITEH